MKNLAGLKHLARLFDIKESVMIFENLFKTSPYSMTSINSTRQVTVVENDTNTIMYRNISLRNQVNGLISMASSRFFQHVDADNNLDTIIYMVIPNDIPQDSDIITNIRNVMTVEHTSVVCEFNGGSTASISTSTIAPYVPSGILYNNGAMPCADIRPTYTCKVTGQTLARRDIDKTRYTWYAFMTSESDIESIAHSLYEHDLLSYVVNVHCPVETHADEVKSCTIDLWIFIEHILGGNIDDYKRIVLSARRLRPTRALIFDKIEKDPTSSELMPTKVSIEYHEAIDKSIYPVGAYRQMIANNDDPVIVVEFEYDNVICDSSDIITDAITNAYKEGKAYFYRFAYDTEKASKKKLVSGGRIFVSLSKLHFITKMLKISGCPGENINLYYSPKYAYTLL